MQRKTVVFLVLAAVLVLAAGVTVAVLLARAKEAKPTPTATATPTIITDAGTEPVAVVPAAAPPFITGATIGASRKRVVGGWTLVGDATDASVEASVGDTALTHDGGDAQTASALVRLTSVGGQRASFTLNGALAAQSAALSPAGLAAGVVAHSFAEGSTERFEGDPSGASTSASYAGGTVAYHVGGSATAHRNGVLRWDDDANDWLAHDMGSGAVFDKMAVCVSGDGDTVMRVKAQEDMGTFYTVLDWDADASAWVNGTTGLPDTQDDPVAVGTDWGGLVLATVETHNAPLNMNNLNEGYADDPLLRIRRRASRASAWGAAQSADIGSTLTADVCVSHDGNLVLVQDRVNNHMRFAAWNGSAYAVGGTTTFTSAGSGVLGPATKSVMAAALVGDDLVAERWVIDDFDSASPSWTLAETVTMPSVADNGGYSGTTPRTDGLRFNEDMTVMVLANRTHSSDAAGINGAAQGSTVSQSGRVWVYRRDAGATEWTLEARVDHPTPTENLWFGASFDLARGTDANTLVVTQSGSTSPSLPNGVMLY